MLNPYEINTSQKRGEWHTTLMDSLIFFSTNVGIIKVRKSWEFDCLTLSSSQIIAFLFYSFGILWNKICHFGNIVLKKKNFKFQTSCGLKSLVPEKKVIESNKFKRNGWHGLDDLVWNFPNWNLWEKETILTLFYLYF